MDKKGMVFGMMHPALMFVIGLVVGLALGYYLAMIKIIPIG